MRFFAPAVLGLFHLGSVHASEDPPAVMDYVVAERLYPADYLESLSQEELEAATQPMAFRVDKENGFEILAQDVGNGLLGDEFIPQDFRSAFFGYGGYDKLSFDFAENFADSSQISEDDQKLWFRQSLFEWFEEASCTKESPFEEIPSHLPQNFPGVVELYFLTGGFLDLFAVPPRAELTQVGFKSGAEFPFFAANPRVLGVAFTLHWAVDLNENGKPDVAFREIYYNAEYEWTVDEAEADRDTIDFPSVAIHEMGHGIGNAHFGTIGVRDGMFQANPRAIMNALYAEPMREMEGHDTRAVCNNWANWPGL